MLANRRPVHFVDKPCKQNLSQNFADHELSIAKNGLKLELEQICKRPKPALTTRPQSAITLMIAPSN